MSTEQAREKTVEELDLQNLTDNEYSVFYVRDHFYPFEESFSISEYRRAVSKVRKIRIQTTKLAHDIVGVVDTAG